MSTQTYFFTVTDDGGGVGGVGGGSGGRNILWALSTALRPTLAPLLVLLASEALVRSDARPEAAIALLVSK